MRGVVVVLCALVLAPAALARPLLGLYGDTARFAGQTGQRTDVGHIYLGWGQGSTWGSGFDRIVPKLSRVPMISITTFHWPSKAETLTPLQIARGAGDDYLIALNAAVARANLNVFYVRPLAEMTGWWNPWCAFTRSGKAKGGAHSTANFRKAFARMYLLLHGGTADELNARLAHLGLPGVRADLPVNPFPRLRVIWNPQAHGDPQVPGNTPARVPPPRRLRRRRRGRQLATWRRSLAPARSTGASSRRSAANPAGAASRPRRLRRGRRSALHRRARRRDPGESDSDGSDEVRCLGLPCHAGGIGRGRISIGVIPRRPTETLAPRGPTLTPGPRLLRLSVTRGWSRFRRWNRQPM